MEGCIYKKRFTAEGNAYSLSFLLTRHLTHALDICCSDQRWVVFVANKSSLWSLVPLPSHCRVSCSNPFGSGNSWVCTMEWSWRQKDWKSLGRDVGHQNLRTSRKHWVPLQSSLRGGDLGNLRRPPEMIWAASYPLQSMFSDCISGDPPRGPHSHIICVTSHGLSGFHTIMHCISPCPYHLTFQSTV